MITSSAWFLQAHGEAANAAGGDGTVLHLGGVCRGCLQPAWGENTPMAISPFHLKDSSPFAV